MFERMSDLDRLKKEETLTKGLILEKLAELTIREIHIGLGEEDIKRFKVKQEKNMYDLYHYVNEYNFDEQFDEIICSYEKQKNNDLNNLLNLYTNNLKSLIEQFNN